MKTRVAVIIPTCETEREIFLSRLLARISRQTVVPDYAAVVDYPNAGCMDLAERYRDGFAAAKENLCELCIFMEDDDYYPLTYIEDMRDAWIKHKRPHIIGNWPTRYYHIGASGYRVYPRLKHCSAHCTAVSTAADLMVDGKTFDINLWEANKSAVKISLKKFPVSIKHGLGMTAGRKHGDRKYTPDVGHRVLRSWVDRESYEFYVDVKMVLL